MLITIEEKSDEILRRAGICSKFDGDPTSQMLAKMHYADDVAEWIDDCCFSYNPKELDLPTQPFRLSAKQRELIEWIEGVVRGRHEAIMEKSRDVGATWIFVLYALNRFLFVPGFKTGFGSYHADKVDRIGDPDSIFEKIRIAMDMLPRWHLPQGWDPSRHDNHMRLINPENANTITGEVGGNMGRGGRSSLYVVDEAAFVEHARRAARAVSANSDAKIWMSTANGMANAFYVKRESTRVREPALVFRLHWRDDPRKNEEWARAKRLEMEPEDWASEQEIDYGASTERQLIRAEWVEACRELAKRRGKEIRQLQATRRSGLDVGAGKAESVLATADGPMLIDLKAWRDPDSVDTASMALDRAKELKSTLVKYDATGVGFSQGSIMKRMANGVKVVGVNPGDPPPDYIRIDEAGKSIPASERFANLKALGWWQLRERAKASWEVLWGGVEHPLSDCLLLEGEDPMLDAQLCQPTWSKNLRGKRQVDKTPEGAKSPDRGDAVVLAFLDQIEGRAVRRLEMRGV